MPKRILCTKTILSDITQHRRRCAFICKDTSTALFCCDGFVATDHFRETTKMVGYAIRRITLSETHVPCGTKEEICHPRMENLLVQKPVQAETHTPVRGQITACISRTGCNRQMLLLLSTQTVSGSSLPEGYCKSACGTPES